MSCPERDKQILDLVIRTYDFQFELRKELDSKLNNFIVVTGTLSTISLGVALFSFERVTTVNPYYLPMLVTFFVFFGLFITAMVLGLAGYKPTDLTLYPEDPQRAIQKYSTFSNEIEVVRVVAASLAEASNLNKKMNNLKSEMCKYIFWLLIGGAIAFIMFAIFILLGLNAIPLS
jgi:hypothetical protein